MQRVLIMSITILIGLGGRVVLGQTPLEIGHQGILTDSLGNPIVEGSFDLKFSLYDQEVGGTMLWTEQQTVTVEEGLFTTWLGSVNPIELAFDAPYWLQIDVDGDALDPRLRFATAPYSRRSATVDSVGAESIPVGSVPADRISAALATPGMALIAIGADSVGWALIDSANVAKRAIASENLNPTGGSSGQVLTVQGDSVAWADPPEITGAAIPDKSVRATKLNAEDGVQDQVMLAAGQDSVVWGLVGVETLSDRAVSSAKLSASGAATGQILMARGDSVDWVNPEELGEGTLSVSELSTQGASVGQVLTVTENDSAGWGLVDGLSVQDGSIAAGKIDPEAAVDGQILTAEAGAAVWKDPAAIGKGTLPFDRISANGAAPGEVISVVSGDTVSWSQVTLGGISTDEGSNGEVLQIIGGNADWALVNGASVVDASVPISKIDPGSASQGNVLKFDGSEADWAADGLQLPFSGTTLSTDTVGIRVFSPSVIEGTGFAIQGVMTSTNGGAFASAIRGENRSTSALGVGVWGSHEGGGWGVYGRSTSGRGVFGSSPDGFAGYFSGNVRVTGSIEKAGGSFKIDHPLDPEGKYLSHSFVESPDMMNVYNGNVTLDGSGEAAVFLPDWFEALNKDYRYQLTAIGAPGPNLYVAQEVSNNQFRIAGGAPGMKVSWQVTGVRNDSWARSNRIPVEEQKTGSEIGTYLHPEVFGVSSSRGVDAATEQRSVER